MRFLLLPLTAPLGAALQRVRDRIPLRVSRVVVPETGRRRDFLRAMAGFPVALLALGGATVVASQSGCAPGQTNLAVTQVDSFTVGHTSEDGMSLQDALIQRAREQGITLAWHQSTAPDQVDAATSVEGLRLVRWDYRYGSSTDARHYLFEVYDESGDPIGNEPTLETVLHRGYSVVVLEVSAASSA